MVYMVCLYGGPIEEYRDVAKALERAEAELREDPDALVSIVLCPVKDAPTPA